MSKTQSKTVYILDEFNALAGEAFIPETEVTSAHVVVPPPPFSRTHYVAVWSFESNKWEVSLSTRGRDLLWEEVINQRNKLLASTDWAVLPDVDLSAEVKENVLKYRQQLRDITDDFSDPRTVEFPKFPL